MASQKVHIFFDNIENAFPSLFTELDEPRRCFRQNHEVDILQCRGAFDFAHNFPIDKAAFQIKYVLEVFWVPYLERVLHHHQVNFVRQLRLKSEYAEYFADKTVWILLVVTGK